MGDGGISCAGFSTHCARYLYNWVNHEGWREQWVSLEEHWGGTLQQVTFLHHEFTGDPQDIATRKWAMGFPDLSNALTNLVFTQQKQVWSISVSSLTGRIVVNNHCDMHSACCMPYGPSHLATLKGIGSNDRHV